MNKLDEILKKLALELEVNDLDVVMLTGEICRDMLIREAKQAIIELIDEKVIGELTGLQYMYEHHWVGDDKERVCEYCGEIVKKGTPCKESIYYNTWFDIQSTKEKIEKKLKELV